MSNKRQCLFRNFSSRALAFYARPLLRYCTLDLPIGGVFYKSCIMSSWSSCDSVATKGKHAHTIRIPFHRPVGERMSPKLRDEASGLFVKRAAPDSASLEGEAAALRWLAEAAPAGGMPAADVVSANATELVERCIAMGSPNAEAAERVGAALAVTHAAGAPWWGAPPPGWQGSYLIRGSYTPTVPESAASHSWGAFFAEWRVMPYLRQARDAGAIDQGEARVFERVATRLQGGEFDAPQPALVCAGGFEAARIHGDLWSGNLLWDADGDNHVGATLIDPMAHGGHAETDLAMLALFGCPFLKRIIAAYEEASPLAEGWRERVPLHQLAPLLHHCALYGRSYTRSALDAAKPFAPTSSKSGKA